MDIGAPVKKFTVIPLDNPVPPGREPAVPAAPEREPAREPAELEPV